MNNENKNPDETNEQSAETAAAQETLLGLDTPSDEDLEILKKTLKQSSENLSDSPESGENLSEDARTLAPAGKLGGMQPGGVYVVQDPRGAGLAAQEAHKKKLAGKCFINFQAPRVMKVRLDSVAKRNDINISEYFRQCAELLIQCSNSEETIVEIQKLANSLVFKRKKKGRPRKDEAKKGATGKLKV